jgi:glycosyltransferase involved in cell wall biosynthesis
VHLFAQSVADVKIERQGCVGVPLPSRGSIHWHRVPTIPGPQLIRFTAWFVLNRWWRSRCAFDLVISPGINCLDADMVIVHALFSRLAEISSSNSDANPGILRNLHRKAYYSLLRALERRVYRDRRVAIAAVSQRTASLVAQYFGRDDIRVIANGVDSAAFSPEGRLARRESSRSQRGLQPHEFVLLLIGNDCATKGIYTVFEAMAMLPLRLLIVGSDVRELLGCWEAMR